MSRYLTGVYQLRKISEPLRDELESEYGPCTVESNGKSLIIRFYHRDACQSAFNRVYRFLNKTLPGMHSLKSYTDVRYGKLVLRVGL